MYFSMDDIGQENVDSVRMVPDSASKWRFIDRVASEFGFTGIQLCPKYPEEYGLDTVEVPDYIRRSFRLTYHFGDCGTLLDDEDQQRWSGVFAEGLEIASKMGAEDVSLHPPVLADYSSLPVSDRTEAERRSQVAKERLLAILDEWIGRFGSRGISLSLETHVTPLVFCHRWN